MLAPVALSVADWPGQMLPTEAVALTEICAVTPKAIVAVLLQLPLLPVTVYNVGTEGEAETIAPLVADKPAAGLQV